jgi:hypothetical protein
LLAKLLKLEKLDVQQTKITAAGIEALRKALPKCRIEWDGGALESAETPASALPTDAAAAEK